MWLAFSAGLRLIVVVLNTFSETSPSAYVLVHFVAMRQKGSALVCFCSRKLAGPKGRKRIGWMEFRLFHYAGEVTYCTKGECPGGHRPQVTAMQMPVSAEEIPHTHCHSSPSPTFEACHLKSFKIYLLRVYIYPL